MSECTVGQDLANSITQLAENSMSVSMTGPALRDAFDRARGIEVDPNATALDQAISFGLHIISIPRCLVPGSAGLDCW